MGREEDGGEGRGNNRWAWRGGWEGGKRQGVVGEGVGGRKAQMDLVL